MRKIIFILMVVAAACGAASKVLACDQPYDPGDPPSYFE
jgi:hypothetical protein